MRFYENRGTEWLPLTPSEMAIEVKAIEENRQTRYVDATAGQMMRWYDAGLCAWCGSKSKGDCFCRRCDSCTRTWIADTIKDTDDGMPPFEDCPECLEG